MSGSEGVLALQLLQQVPSTDTLTRTASCCTAQSMQGGPVSMNKHPHAFPLTKCTIMLGS